MMYSLLLKLMITDKLKMSHFRMTSFLYQDEKEGHQSQGCVFGQLQVFKKNACTELNTHFVNEQFILVGSCGVTFQLYLSWYK